MKKFLFVFLLGVLSVSAFSQRITVKSGDLSKIKGETQFNIEYDYSDMSVGKYDNEEDYVNRKVSDYNEKEPGRGDKWKESWVGDRKSRFEPKFEELMNKYLNKADAMVGDEFEDAKYTFILKTTFTEPGYNIYISKKNASIDVILSIVETGNRENVVAEIISKKNPGRSMGMDDYDTGARISEAYAKCGKDVGKYIYKKALK